MEIGGQSSVKGTPEEHGRSRVPLLPTVKVPVTIAAWTSEILADLGVAVGHPATSELFVL